MNRQFARLAFDTEFPLRREFFIEFSSCRLVVAPLFLCLLFACGEPDASAQHNVAGELTLSLPQRGEGEKFVRFTIERHDLEGASEIIASSGYRPVVKSPVKFSLTYRGQTINDLETVVLVTRIAVDPQGLDEITSMTSRIYNDAQGRYLYLAIELPPEPLALKKE